ncbi:MAG: OmpA family protein [Proteobacteria bacterium]|nr:OmpA family protein [Pseudomonadota bacterium]
MRRLLLLLPLLVLPALAVGQGQLLSYALKPAVQSGDGYPQVYLTANDSFDKVTLTCERSDGGSVNLSKSSVSKGKKITFDLKQPTGEFNYDCEARGYYGSGEDEFFDLYFRFDAFLGGGLAIEVPRDEIDLKNSTLTARADRVVGTAHLTIVTPDGPQFDEDVDVGENSAGDDLWLEWSGVRGDVLRIDVTLTDRWGFYSYENIFPWSLEIPHEDINFDTGAHVMRDDEKHKVDSAYKDAKEVFDRYSKYVEVRLYIAGYTDTVGPRGDNQALSERRARSIAQEFRNKGFVGPLYYQGFGEDALAMATEDSVDLEANRRAMYILASRPPARSENFPRGNWKKL